MIEKQDDLYPLMFDIQLAYAFQDVEKDHNPTKKQIIISREKKTKICDQTQINKDIVVNYPNCKRLNVVMISHIYSFLYLI